MKIDLSKSYLFKLHYLNESLTSLVDNTLRAHTGIGLPPRKLLSSVRLYQPSTQQQLSAFMRLTPGAVSRQVEQAKRKGWVVIKNDKTDRRKQLVELTAEGLRVLEEGETHMLKLMPKLLGNEAERLAFLEQLDTVQAKIDAIRQS
jgi:DNA-binding MarR family transcriptional regulator